MATHIQVRNLARNWKLALLCQAWYFALPGKTVHDTYRKWKRLNLYAYFALLTLMGIPG